MFPSIPLALVVALALVALAPLAQDASPKDDPSATIVVGSGNPVTTGTPGTVVVREDGTVVVAPGAPPARVERFVLERRVEGELEPVALVAWSRVERADELVLEREIHFRDGDLRVVLTERSGPSGPRLVWRELPSESSHGRTWLAEWDSREASVRTTEWGTRRPVHGAFESGRSPWTPLTLVESLRSNDLPATRVDCLDPLSASVERTSLRVAEPDRLDAGPAGALVAWRRPDRRVVERRHADGALAERLVFEGPRLVAFQLHDGGPWARAIDPREANRIRDAWRTSATPLRDR